ncbi:MAG: hypothetical protein R3Y56_04560 [Akkermansia sp.]
MKRLLLPSLCALLSLTTLTSCQKEEESSLSLAKKLTAELQTVVDTPTAEAAAPRVAAINQRFQDAGIQVFAINGTALLRSSERPAEYNEALAALAVEMGRIRASKPVATADGEIDRDALIKAVGIASTGGDPKTPASASKKAGTDYYKDSIDATHGSAGEFATCYGSTALAEALDYVADPSSVDMFTFAGDVPEIPAATEVAVEEDDAVIEEEDTASEEPIADEATEEVGEDISIDEVDGDDEVIDEEETDSDSEEDSSDDSEALDIDFGDIGI